MILEGLEILEFFLGNFNFFSFVEVWVDFVVLVGYYRICYSEWYTVKSGRRVRVELSCGCRFVGLVRFRGCGGFGFIFLGFFLSKFGGRIWLFLGFLVF